MPVESIVRRSKLPSPAFMQVVIVVEWHRDPSTAGQCFFSRPLISISFSSMVLIFVLVLVSSTIIRNVFVTISSSFSSSLTKKHCRWHRSGPARVILCGFTNVLFQTKKDAQKEISVETSTPKSITKSKQQQQQQQQQRIENLPTWSRAFKRVVGECIIGQ